MALSGLENTISPAALLSSVDKGTPSQVHSSVAVRSSLRSSPTTKDLVTSEAAIQDLSLAKTWSTWLELICLNKIW